MLFSDEELTGYFSDKYSSYFTDFVDGMDRHYPPECVIPASECSELGIIIVNQEKERMSFLRGFPFLILGLLLFMKAGNPFFCFPENSLKN